MLALQILAAVDAIFMISFSRSGAIAFFWMSSRFPWSTCISLILTQLDCDESRFLGITPKSTGSTSVSLLFLKQLNAIVAFKVWLQRHSMIKSCSYICWLNHNHQSLFFSWDAFSISHEFLHRCQWVLSQGLLMLIGVWSDWWVLALRWLYFFSKSVTDWLKHLNN